MKRNLQEGKSSERKIIYEGNGFCRVMKGSKLVERLQLEKGDDLMEALKGGKLMEGTTVTFNDNLIGDYDGKRVFSKTWVDDNDPSYTVTLEGIELTDKDLLNDYVGAQAYLLINGEPKWYASFLDAQDLNRFNMNYFSKLMRSLGLSRATDFSKLEDMARKCHASDFGRM